MSESIGNKLKAARESRRLTIEQAAEATRIRVPYLQALEKDDFSAMVSAAQGRGFLRLYADFLGLNLDAMTADLRDSKPVASSIPAADSTPPAEATPEPTPAPEAKHSRPGFWARLLRREPPPKEESKPAEESVPEPAAVTMAEPVAVVTSAEEEPIKPARKTSTAKKSPRKNSASLEGKPKPAARKAASGKKKRTLSRLSKN